MKFRVVQRGLLFNKYLEIFDTRVEAEAACQIYEKLKTDSLEKYEVLEGASVGGILYFADPEVPEDYLIAVSSSLPSSTRFHR